MQSPYNVLIKALEVGRNDDIRLTTDLFGLKDLIENDSNNNK